MICQCHVSMHKAVKICRPGGEKTLPDGMQAEHLKRELLAKIVETKAGCEATIEAKAVQLAAALESTDRCPCVTAPSTQWWALVAACAVHACLLDIGMLR